MENNINENNKHNSLLKKENNLDVNPNIIFKEEIASDCYYDYYQINSNLDIYNLNSDKEKIFISYISQEDNKLIIHSDKKLLDISRFIIENHLPVEDIDKEHESLEDIFLESVVEHD
jgi:ABC-2 type transport system ATP-binding protein